MLKLYAPMFALMLCPVAVMATPVPQASYDRFVLSEAAAERMYSTRYTACLDDAGGVTMSIRECIDAEFKKIDMRLNASYKKALARLNASSKAKLRRDERSWLKTRLDKCERDLEGDKGGTQWFIEMDDCALQEHMRRTAWIESKGS